MNKRTRDVFGAAKDSLRETKGGMWPENVVEVQAHYESLEAVCKASEIVVAALRGLSMTPPQCEVFKELAGAIERERPLRPKS